jgi:1,4-alpha-glucan branching enzyme
MLSADDLHLFNEGRHFRLYHVLGAHPQPDGGTQCAVWAPNARVVSVVTDANDWEGGRDQLRPVESSGIWAGVVPRLGPGDRYQYRIETADGPVDKADPFAFATEVPPHTASRVCPLEFTWTDREWMGARGERQALDAPQSVYEVHLGSWCRHDDGRSLSYREIAEPLARHASELGFTHVELLPVMEHPFFGSWGYQTTGYFAPSSRYGDPHDLMALIDELHRHGIGVILDWVPSHFPDDPHGLARFDGTALYEHADPRQGHHPDWDTCVFNLGRNEVRAFLGSSACFWLDRYHADGLRVDAVASMLYLDYSRREGEWIPNQYGGRENIEALSFLRDLNAEVYRAFPDVQTTAEESTAWPMVSRPTYLGGLGFGLKWDMGWMHDTLQYFARDPVHRSHHLGELTFRLVYAHSENFVLPLSHDEVVHGKGSLLAKMPGDDWQRFANLRLLYGYMYAQPGKKLLFMGAEVAPWDEWSHDGSVPWWLLEHAPHAGVQRWVADLNRLHRDEPALHELDAESAGFEWISADDTTNSVLVFLRRARTGPPVMVACNLTPLVRNNYRVGAPDGGAWLEIANSDAADYGGSGVGNLGRVEASPIGRHGRPWSLTLTLPPLAAVMLRPDTGPA